MEIIYKAQFASENVEIKLVYIEKNSPRNYRHIGHQVVKVTQCMCYVDNMILSFGTVVKHAKDENNPNLAKRLATKKALDAFRDKKVKKEIWKMVLDATK